MVRLVGWLLIAGALAAEPAPFEDVVRRAVSECASEAVLKGVDCAGSPCVAKFADPDLAWRAIVGCPPWRERFGSTASTMGGRAECADGSLRPFFLIAPDTGGFEAFARVVAVRDVWPCGRGDDSEPTPARRRR